MWRTSYEGGYLGAFPEHGFAAPLLIAAYAFVWVALMVYLWSIWSRLGRVERDLQELLAEAPQWCGEGFRLVRREWPTDIGPVDLMCRDGGDGWVAVEIKRVATIDAVEQLSRYLERIRLTESYASHGTLRCSTPCRRFCHADWL